MAAHHSEGGRPHATAFQTPAESMGQGEAQGAKEVAACLWRVAAP